MKKVLAILLSCTMLLTGCSLQDAVDKSSENSQMTKNQITVSETESTISSETESQISNEQEDSPVSLSVDTRSEEYINSLGFTSLNDPDLMRYVEDTVYSDLVEQLGSDDYLVENVEAVYISKEYLDELAYNSQENIYFGYKLSELDEAFKGEKYIFTLGENGQTEVVPFEEYDGTYDTVIRNVAIGTGVILLCVTVSVVSAGAGAGAVSVIFAASAGRATTLALKSAAFGGVSAAIVTGAETGDFEEVMKAAALEASEGFKWGAIWGAIDGGASESIALKGATLNGLTMNQAATIQKESKYPLDVIKQFKSMEEYQVYKKAGLTVQMVDGKVALMQNIDLNFKSTMPDGTEATNLQRMLKGYAPLDPATGKAYQLHHIGQKADGTLAVLTEAQHQGNSAILNTLGKESEIDRAAFAKVREAFWKNAGKLFQPG